MTCIFDCALPNAPGTSTAPAAALEDTNNNKHPLLVICILIDKAVVRRH